jgi:hypothetical protein
MTELHSIYKRLVGVKSDFLRRIILLVFADAHIGTRRDRLVYAEHWRAEFEEMEKNFRNLGAADYKLYKAMQQWYP